MNTNCSHCKYYGKTCDCPLRVKYGSCNTCGYKEVKKR